MVTRRESLKVVVSALLLPSISKLGLASNLASRSRITDSDCPSCLQTQSLSNAFSNILDSAKLLKNVSVPTAIYAVSTQRGALSYANVESSTGNLVFGTKDLVLDGLPGVVAARLYNSSSAEDAGLGRGWKLSIDDRVVVTAKTATIYAASGEVANLQSKNAKTYVHPHPGATDRAQLTVNSDGTLTERPSSFVAKNYIQIAGVYYLSSISYGNKTQIVIQRDVNGRPVSMSNPMSGAMVTFNWTGGPAGQLSGLTDSTGRTVYYQYADGLLSKVVDVTGASWTMKYQSQQLVSLEDPEGTAILTSSYSANRVVSVSTVDESFSFEYPTSNTTVVKDALSNQTVLTHNTYGQLTNASSADGKNVAMANYNAEQRLSAVVNSDGWSHRRSYDADGHLTLKASGKNWTQWAFDASGQLSQKTNAAGTITYGYDDSGRVIKASGKNGRRSYVLAYGPYGGANLMQTPKRQVAYERNSSGLTTSISDSRGARISFDRSPQGWSMAVKYASGQGAMVTRDLRGDVLQWNDSSGNKIQYQRDRRGAITAISNSAGEWVKAERDSSGKISQITNSRGQSRSFQYDVAGRLTQFTDAKARTFSVQYDSSNRAIRMSQTNGSLVIERGTDGTSTIASSTSATDATSNTSSNASKFKDGWFDPLYADGLLGAFSGFASIAVKTQAKKSPLTSPLLKKLARMEDYGDDDDDAPPGDDDDDDDPTDPYHCSGEAYIDCYDNCNGYQNQQCDSRYATLFAEAQGTEIAAIAACRELVNPISIAACIAAAEGSYQLAMQPYYDCQDAVENTCINACAFEKPSPACD